MIKIIRLPNIGDYPKITIVDIPISTEKTIKKNDIILVIETGKASIEIPSPYEGIIKKINISIGDIIKKNCVILTIDTKETEVKQLSKDHNNSNLKNLNNNKIENIITYASPYIRRKARELNLNIKEIKGSGKNNRITETDIIKNKDILNTTLNNKNLTEIKKLSNDILYKNWTTIPHVTQFDKADITNLILFYKKEKEKAQHQNIKLTLLPFIIKVIGNLLTLLPKFRSKFSDNKEQIIIKKYCNIGIVTNTDTGLKIPIINNVNNLNIIEIAKELNAKATQAKNNSLTKLDFQESCFTISNLGNTSNGFFTPIINSKEVAILGISKYQDEAIIIDKQIKIRTMLPLSLSYDHRVIDGLDAANFMKKLSLNLNDIRLILM